MPTTHSSKELCTKKRQELRQQLKGLVESPIPPKPEAPPAPPPFPSLNTDGLQTLPEKPAMDFINKLREAAEKSA